MTDQNHKKSQVFVYLFKTFIFSQRCLSGFYVKKKRNTYIYIIKKKKTKHDTKNRRTENT